MVSKYQKARKNPFPFLTVSLEEKLTCGEHILTHFRGSMQRQKISVRPVFFSLTPSSSLPHPLVTAPTLSSCPVPFTPPQVVWASWGHVSAWWDSSFRRRTAHPRSGQSGSGSGSPLAWTGSLEGCLKQAESYLGSPQTPKGTQDTAHFSFFDVQSRPLNLAPQWLQ